MHDLRMALRRLRRRPGRAFATALTLAIGIGATTAAYAAVHGVLLRGLPVERQDELVVVWHLNPERGSLRIPFRAASFDVVARGAGSLAEVAGYSAWGALPAVVDDGDGASALLRVPIAGDFFGVLGARPALGRLLDASDDALDAAPVAVLGHGAWVNRFGAAPDVIGTTLVLDGTTLTVVGVAPAGLDFPRGTEVWVPIRGDYGNWPDTGAQNDVELHVLGRMVPGADAATVAADVGSALAVGSEAGAFTSWATMDPVVRGLEDHVVGASRPVVRAAFGAALGLLLAAAANAVLLLLAGGRTMVQEIAVERALGAGRGRVVSRLVADSALVGAIGTAGGLVVAGGALRVLLPLAPPELHRLEAVTFGAPATAFAVTAGLVSTLLIGSVAGLLLARIDVRGVLATGSRGGSGRSARLGRAVAGLQVGLAVVSAVGAGLLGRTVVAMNRIDPGLSADDMTAVSLRVPYGWMDVPASYLGALEAVVRDLESRAGVIAARPSLGPPLEQRLEVVLTAEGQDEDAADANPYVAVDAVLPGHLEALGIPLMAGRDLTAADDRPDAEPVVVVDEVLARALWPGQGPIGKRINGFGYFDTWFRVVGVAAGTRYRDFLEPHPRAYYPLHRLGNSPPSALLVRSSGLGTEAVGRLAREALERADPRVRVLDAQPMADLLHRPTAGRRFAAGVLASFGVATLLLAAVGVYGVFTVAVRERTREMGVRRALGAQRGGIVRLVLTAILKVAGIGALLGLVAALWAGRLVESLLYGVEANDPMTLGAVVVGCVVLALVAGLVPAVRASAIDPAVSLRSE